MNVFLLSLSRSDYIIVEMNYNATSPRLHYNYETARGFG